MRATFNIRSALRQSAGSARRLEGFRQRRFVGALLALTGFVFQYPVPVIHQCPVMNPQGIDLLADHDHDAHDHDHSLHAQDRAVGRSPARRLAGLQSVANSAAGDAHEHLPACHRRLLALADAPGEDEHATASAHSGDRGGHSHDSCPVCQGHAQLLPDLPQALAALDSHFYLISLRPPALVQTIVQPELERLPNSRAPPA